MEPTNEIQEPVAPQGAATSAPAGDPKQKKNGKALKTMAIGAGASILILLLAALVVFTVGLYKYGWEGPATSQIVHALPYPVAVVNGTKISYADYVDDIGTVRHFFAKEKEQNTPGFQAPSDTDLRKGVLDRLIETEILKQEAAKYNITVSKDDIDKEFDAFAKQGNGEDPAKQIGDLYGWSVDQFKEKVLRPYVLQSKLAEALAKDNDLNAAAEAKANDVLAKLKAGGDFAELAKTESADTGSAQQGGELGWFDKGIMVPEFEQAAFALKPGELSGVVKTQFGYHIIKCEDVKKDKKTGEVTSVKASHILIAGPSVSDYLGEKLKAAKVDRYLKL